MWKYTWLLAAVAACSDIPGKDDPRTTIEWGSANPDAATDASMAATGSCTGQVLPCTARPSGACGSDCMDVIACAGQNHDECTTYATNSSECTSDTNCQFVVYTCQAVGDGECGADLTQSDCENDTLAACAWGETCEGQPEQCRQATNASGCAALPGCTWTPSG
jgi:hypothetical protein